MDAVPDSDPAEGAVTVQLVEALRLASITPSKQRVTKVSAVVDPLCETAFRNGLSSTALKAIIDIVSRKTELDQTSVTTLIKNLYPTEKIPSAVVTTLVAGLGQGRNKSSNATQAALIRWLTTVCGVLIAPQILSQLYSVFFNLLDMMSLRTPLCHLLSLITRRRHVRPYRIQYLLELSRRVGNEPALVALLRVYKDYYPDIIIGKTVSSRASLPPQPDSEWSQKLHAIQQTSTNSNRDGEYARDGFRVLRHQGRGSRRDAVPEVHTSRAQESSITLEEIENVEDFVEKLEKVELPNQLIASLRDPVLQKLLHLNPDPIASTRLDLWLSSCFEDEIELAKAESPPSPQFSSLLENLLSFTRTNKSLHPLLDSFVKHYLPIWDGQSNVLPFYGLLEYIPNQPFQDAHKSYFRWLEKSLRMNDDQLPDMLLLLYGNVARVWGVRQSDSTVQRPSGRDSTAFEHLSKLVEHVDVLVLSMLSARPFSGSLHSAILSFYELVMPMPTARDASSNSHIPIVFPPDQIVHHLMFHSSLSDVSRLCSILANCKCRFDSMKTTISEYYPSTYTNKFNGHLMDICNLVWRGRALNSTDLNATGCLCPGPTQTALQAYIPLIERDYNLPSYFGLSYHYLISAISIASFRSAEDSAEKAGTVLQTRHAGPVTLRSLPPLVQQGGLSISLKEYRVGVLSTLDEKGLGGIKGLMVSTMVNLQKSLT